MQPEFNVPVKIRSVSDNSRHSGVEVTHMTFFLTGLCVPLHVFMFSNNYPRSAAGSAVPDAADGINRWDMFSPTGSGGTQGSAPSWTCPETLRREASRWNYSDLPPDVWVLDHHLLWWSGFSSQWSWELCFLASSSGLGLPRQSWLGKHRQRFRDPHGPSKKKLSQTLSGPEPLGKELGGRPGRGALIDEPCLCTS